MSGRDDIVTLQNPHGLPSVSVNKAPVKAAEPEKKVVPQKSAVAVVKTKAPEPCKQLHMIPFLVLTGNLQGMYRHTRAVTLGRR
jgi:hypothetical protein